VQKSIELNYVLHVDMYQCAVRDSDTALCSSYDIQGILSISSTVLVTSAQLSLVSELLTLRLAMPASLGVDVCLQFTSPCGLSSNFSLVASCWENSEFLFMRLQIM